MMKKKKKGGGGNLADGTDDFEPNGSGLKLRSLSLLIPLCVSLLRFDLLLSPRHLVVCVCVACDRTKLKPERPTEKKYE